ncbi:MAG: hypothetical protein WCF96_02780 [Eubacteriales bacterium]
MEFSTSKAEIKRRKTAYISLVLFLVVGFLLFSKLLQINILPSIYISVIAVFFVLGMLSFKFLNKILKIKIHISDCEIERSNLRTSEKFRLSEVERLIIKRRKNASIREIHIFFAKGKHLYISAFEGDFENLSMNLVQNLDKSISIEETHEHINFDNILFYPSLGLLLGLCFAFLLKAIINVDYEILKIYMFSISSIAFAIGLYFAFQKPLAMRSNSNQAVIDYVMAILMIISSIYIFSLVMK